MNTLRHLVWITLATLAIALQTADAVAQSCASASPESSGTTATSGTFRVYAYGVSGAYQVLFPTWGEAGGQDDLIWYAGSNAGNGTWYVDVNLANHKSGSPEYGTFHTHVYMNGAAFVGCAATTWTRSVATPSCTHSAPQSWSTTATSGGFRIYAYGVQNATMVHFPTWGEYGGQDDLIWYAGQPAGGGTWYVDVNLANHKAGAPEFGTFHTHVYPSANGVFAYCSGIAWTRQDQNNPPSISLTFPRENGQKEGRPLGTPLTLTSSASDDRGIARVEYYANGAYVGQSSVPPYAVQFGPSFAGLYSITARAVDTHGVASTSGIGHAAFARMVQVVNSGFAQPFFVRHLGSPSQWFLPHDVWHMAIRNTVKDPTTVGLSGDFSTYYTAGYCAFPVNGRCTLTNFSPPPNTATTRYQVGHFDGTANETSAFQMYGEDFASFINTFQSGCAANLVNSVAEIRLSNPVTVFDGDPRTELVLEAELEVPLIYHEVPTARAQLSLFAYFRNSANNATFAVLLGVYDSKEATPPTVANDGFDWYMSTSIAQNNEIVSVNARNGEYFYPGPGPGGQSNLFTTSLWKGKKLFRGFVSREKVLAKMGQLGLGGQLPEDFRLYNAGVLHEVPCQLGNMSTVYHGSGFRVHSARYY